jgi:hypothetical protein
MAMVADKQCKGSKPFEPLSAVEGVLAAIAAEVGYSIKSVSEALKVLNGRSLFELAGRLRRLSRARNAAAHPDVDIEVDIQAAMKCVQLQVADAPEVFAALQQECWRPVQAEAGVVDWDGWVHGKLVDALAPWVTKVDELTNKYAEVEARASELETQAAIARLPLEVVREPVVHLAAECGGLVGLPAAVALAAAKEIDIEEKLSALGNGLVAARGSFGDPWGSKFAAIEDEFAKLMVWVRERSACGVGSPALTPLAAVVTVLDSLGGGSGDEGDNLDVATWMGDSLGLPPQGEMQRDGREVEGGMYLVGAAVDTDDKYEFLVGAVVDIYDKYEFPPFLDVKVEDDFQRVVDYQSDRHCGVFEHYYYPDDQSVGLAPSRRRRGRRNATSLHRSCGAKSVII